MASSKLKLGFIGGGVNSAVGYAHYCASQLDGHFELFAGTFSREEKINKESAELYGLTDNLFSSWQEMLDSLNNELDAVVILTPTPSHFEIIKACFIYNIAIICEKSVTATSQQCAELVKLKNEYSGRVFVTYNYSGYPMVREIKKLVENKLLGDIKHIKIEMPQEGFSRLVNKGQKPCPQSWRLKDNEIPTIYLDLAVHMHHLIHYTTGLQPQETIAHHGSFGWFSDLVDDVSAIVKYNNSVKAQYWFSKSALGHRNGLQMTIYGSLGSVTWVQSEPELLTMAHVDGRKEIIERGADCLIAESPRLNRFKAGHPAGFIEAFANLYQDFYNALRALDSDSASNIIEQYGLEVSYEGLSLLSKMVESSKSEKWECIEC